MMRPRPSGAVEGPFRKTSPNPHCQVGLNWPDWTSQVRPHESANVVRAWGVHLTSVPESLLPGAEESHSLRSPEVAQGMSAGQAWEQSPSLGGVFCPLPWQAFTFLLCTLSGLAIVNKSAHFIEVSGIDGVQVLCGQPTQDAVARLARFFALLGTALGETLREIPSGGLLPWWGFQKRSARRPTLKADLESVLEASLALLCL